MSQRYHNRPTLPMSGSRDAGNLLVVPLICLAVAVVFVILILT